MERTARGRTKTFQRFYWLPAHVRWHAPQTILSSHARRQCPRDRRRDQRARYERRSLLITASQPFGAWNAILSDPAMTVAAIDRLVHHAIILEMNTDSYRRRSAESRAVARQIATANQETT
jgi:hypothetical protein